MLWTSSTGTPASAIAFWLASRARLATVVPESLEYSVHPMPVMAAPGPAPSASTPGRNRGGPLGGRGLPVVRRRAERRPVVLDRRALDAQRVVAGLALDDHARPEEVAHRVAAHVRAAALRARLALDGHLLHRHRLGGRGR